MANNFEVNPHSVDTVMTDTLMNTTPRRPADAPIEIVSIYWFNPATIGDVFTVQDADGNTIKTGRCEAANQSQEFDMHGLEVSDYKVSALDSGVLYIQRRKTGQLA